MAEHGTTYRNLTLPKTAPVNNIDQTKLNVDNTGTEGNNHLRSVAIPSMRENDI